MIHRLIFGLIALLCTTSVFAYSDEQLAKEISILLERIKQEHVKPRAINAEFAHAVNLNFIEYLDPDKLIFNNQDDKDFTAKEADLLNDLNNSSLVYYQFVLARYSERLGAMTKLSTEVYGTKIPPVFAGKSLEIGKARPNSSDQVNAWKQYFTVRYYDQLVDHLKPTETAFPKDSLLSWSDQTRTALSKRTSESLKEWQNRDQLSHIFLNAIAQAFDPHTFFFNPESKKSFEEELSSEREIYGISMELDLSNETHITRVAPGGPAWLSNEVHEGDKVLEITFVGDKKITLDGDLSTYNSIMQAFDETSSKEIELVLEDGENKRKVVHLKKSKVYSDEDIIKNAVLKNGDRKVGYVALPDFYVNWTDTSSLGCANDLAKCVLKLKKDTISGLILDLRGNGGGSLKEAIDIAGIFIDYGPVLATKEKDGSVHILKDFNRGLMYSGPLMIMIDEMSASASEIVASTLQDYNRAVIFGTPSFGKATSQMIYPLDPKLYPVKMNFLEEDKALGYANITNGQLYRITGKWNQLKGVQPDILWKLTSTISSETGERELRNVLLPDSITKKITFQPAVKLDTGRLTELSEKRVVTEKQFLDYAALVNKIDLQEAQFEKSAAIISLENTLQMRNTLIKFSEELKAFEKQLICTFDATANHFDRDLITTDEILDMYNKQFLDQLEHDIQLMEGFNIMNDLINNR